MTSTQSAPQQLSVLAVNKQSCLTCSHLVAWAESTFDCVSPGNPHCPAQCVKIVVGFNLVEVAGKIHASILSGDAAKLSQQMTKLSQHDTYIQQQVLTLVNNLSVKANG